MNEKDIASVRVVWLTGWWMMESPVKIYFTVCIDLLVLFSLLGPLLLIWDWLR